MKNKILVALIITIGLLLICYVLMNNSENEDNSSLMQQKTRLNMELFQRSLIRINLFMEKKLTCFKS